MRPYGRMNSDFGGGRPFCRISGDPRRGGRRGTGRGRVLDSGELRLLLLSLIADGPRHGYDLIRAVEELSGGAYAPSPGISYPSLAILEDVGQIAATGAESGRKAYAITEAGQAELAEKAAQIAALKTRLGSLGSVDKERSAPVRRAMDNLKAVLGDALAGTDKDRPHDIAALIDEAARKIERLD